MNVDENVTAGEAEFSLIGNKLLKRCFQSLAECGSGFYGATVKGKAVPDCTASDGQGSFSERLLFADGKQRGKLSMKDLSLKVSL